MCVCVCVVGGGGGGGAGGRVCSIANYIMKRLNKIETSIFVLLTVLRFQRQPFFFYFY